MSMIHARATSAGLRFRLWSTITDSYLTPELTESEVRDKLREMAINEAIEQHNRTINDRINRTIEKGTSSQMGDIRNIQGPWEEEKN
jgi:hypothetical protein